MFVVDQLIAFVQRNIAHLPNSATAVTFDPVADSL